MNYFLRQSAAVVTRTLKKNVCGAKRLEEEDGKMAAQTETTFLNTHFLTLFYIF